MAATASKIRSVTFCSRAMAGSLTSGFLRRPIKSLSPITRRCGMIAAPFTFWISLDRQEFFLRNTTPRMVSPGPSTERKFGATPPEVATRAACWRLIPRGSIRAVLASPLGMTLQDFAPDGRVLVSLDSEGLAMATSERKGKALDISWHDWHIAKDISRDGKSILFEDGSEAAPAFILFRRHSHWTDPHPYNWETGTQAAFPRTANGQSQFCPGARGE